MRVEGCCFKSSRKESILGKPVCVHCSAEREVKFDQRFCGDATVAHLEREIPRLNNFLQVCSTFFQHRTILDRTVASVKLGTKL